MREYSIHVDVNETVQQFRFYIDENEYYVFSEGLELAMDRQMKVFYCDMPETWKTTAIEKLKLLIRVGKQN
jgi:hypothetical protein